MTTPRIIVWGLLAAVISTGLSAHARASGYEAIVIDDDVAGAPGDGSYAVGEAATVAEAQRIAMSNCTLGRNVACKIQLTFQQCGAYASTREVSGTGKGKDMSSAISAAMAACGRKACKVSVATCVDGPLRPPPY